MTARTVNGSIKIREKHKIFKETGSPFDATPIHSIKVRGCGFQLVVSELPKNKQSIVCGRLSAASESSLIEGTLSPSCGFVFTWKCGVWLELPGPPAVPVYLIDLRAT